MKRQPLGSGKVWAAMAVTLLLGGCDFFRERLATYNLSIKDTPETTRSKPAASRSAAVSGPAVRGAVPRSHDTREASKEPATPTTNSAPQASAATTTPPAEGEKPVSYGYKPSEPPPATASPTAPPAASPRKPDEQQAPPSRMTMGAIGLPRSTDPAKPETDARAISYHLLEEGRRLFMIGRVIDARARLYAGIDSSMPEVILTLARSFDPFYLKQLDTSDGTPNIERAISLYERAIEQGAAGAKQDLERIKGEQRGPATRH